MFKPLLDPYFDPYKDKYIYWTGLQLLLRGIFFSFSAFENNISLISGTTAVSVLLWVQGILCPFKSLFNNVQESLFLLNLLLVYIFASYYKGYKEANNAVVEYLILVVLVYFILFIIYTCVTSMMLSQKLRSLIHEKVKVWKIQKKHRSKIEELNVKNMSSEIPDVTFNYKEFREPLVTVID